MLGTDTPQGPFKYAGGFTPETSGPSLKMQAAEIALDSLPFIGGIKGAVHFAFGKNLVTGEDADRWNEFGGIFLGMVGAKAVTKVDDAYRLGKAALSKGDDVAKAAENVVNPRLTQRLDKWRDYQARSGEADMQIGVRKTQGEDWGLGGKSDLANWSRRVESTHGNSLFSKKPAFLYEKFDGEDNFLKWGMTDNMGRRLSQYRSLEGPGIKLYRNNSGTRRDISVLERFYETTQPGVQNKQKWAIEACNNGLGRKK